MSFLTELLEIFPFGIVEVQTDNDAAFTDKFSSGVSVTGTHRLILVGVKELNGKGKPLANNIKKGAVFIERKTCRYRNRF